MTLRIRMIIRQLPTIRALDELPSPTAKRQMKELIVSEQPKQGFYKLPSYPPYAVPFADTEIVVVSDGPCADTDSLSMRLLLACVASHFRCSWFEKGVVCVADRRRSVIAFRALFVNTAAQKLNSDGPISGGTEWWTYLGRSQQQKEFCTE
jgi:hypothetical protein